MAIRLARLTRPAFALPTFALPTIALPTIVLATIVLSVSTLTLLLTASSTTAAQTEWWQKARVFRTRFYNVKTDLPEEQALELAQHMDITANAYAAIFAGLRIRRPAVLDIYLFANQNDYLQTVQTHFGSNATGSWGLCITRKSSISLVAWRGQHDMEAMKRLLQHEGFHQFASHLFPRLPTWANEGMAEVFERGVAMNGTIVLGEFPETDKKKLVAAGASGTLRPFGEIFAMPSSDWGHQVRQGEASLNYLQAWSMTHFLLYADNSKHQQKFLNFLVTLNRGVPWEQAFVASFGIPNFSVMENLWRQHVQSVAPTDFRETIRRLEFLAAGTTALRAKKTYVENLSELQSELKTIGFQHPSSLFGAERTMKASNDRLFEIPLADLSQAKPVFLLLDSRDREIKPRPPAKDSSTSKGRRASVPLNIVTNGLEPDDFKIRWKRTKARTYLPTLERR